MRLLMISTDKKILEDGSAAQKRHFEYGKICDELHIVVLWNANQPQSSDGAQRECESPPERMDSSIRAGEFTRIPLITPNCKAGESEGMPCKWGDRKKVRIYAVEGRNKILRLWNGYKMAKLLVEKKNINLVTTHDSGFTGLIGYFLKKKYGMKLNIQIHGKEEKLLNKILLFPFQKKIIKSADSIRVVSERLKRLVMVGYGVDAERIYVISIYSEFAGKLRNLKFEIRNCESGKHFTILTVGRLVKVKNIKLQIESLAEVLKIFPNTRLVIVGDGSEKENLQKIAKKFKIEDKVEFAGWVASDNSRSIEQMAEYYRNADLFVLTSNDEGWGMVIIEAMAAGVPVIMTAVGCAGEVVKNGENGIVIQTGDRKALIASICDMIADVDKRNKFSKNGKAVADNLPNKQETLEKYRNMWYFRN